MQREGPPPQKQLVGVPWQQRPAFVTDPIKLRIRTGVLPKEPFPAYEGSCEPLLSARAKSLLEPLAISQLQFLPADVSFESGEVQRFWWLHVCRSIYCVDKKRTKGLFYSPREMLAIACARGHSSGKTAHLPTGRTPLHPPPPRVPGEPASRMGGRGVQVHACRGVVPPRLHRGLPRPVRQLAGHICVARLGRYIPRASRQSIRRMAR
ncbi:imm11 family protein [Myxococcus fulvus]